MDVPVDGDRIDVVAAIDEALVAQVAEDKQLGEGAERHQRHELALVDEHRQRTLGRDRDGSRRAELVADFDLARERRARRGQSDDGRTYLRGARHLRGRRLVARRAGRRAGRRVRPRGLERLRCRRVTVDT
jgi:hypothetical protein